MKDLIDNVERAAQPSKKGRISENGQSINLSEL